WDGLGIDEQADGDSSYSSGAVGGAYAIVTVSGGPYDASAYGEMPEFMTFMEDALALVPSDLRSEGEDLLERYNDGEFGDDGSGGDGSDDDEPDDDEPGSGTGSTGVEA